MMQWVVEKFIALIPAFEKASSLRRDMQDNALRAISHALNETFLYYRDIDDGKPRNLDVEAQLSRYWAVAEIPLRHLDRELAEICEYKSEYWVNPETWKHEDVERLGIGLKKVRDHYRSLLAPKKFSLAGKRGGRDL